MHKCFLQNCRRAGKYAGQVRNFLKQSIKELQQSIKSFEKQIENHKGYIKDPTVKYKDWKRMTTAHKQNALYHWKEDLQRAANYKEMAKQVLKEKIKQGSIIQEGIKHAP